MKFIYAIVLLVSLAYSLILFAGYNAYMEEGGIMPIINELGIFYTSLFIIEGAGLLYVYYLAYRDWKDEKKNGHIY